VGKRIQAARERQHLSQSDLARALGKPRQHIHIIEQGTQYPSVPLLRTIAQVLEVSADYLLALEDEAVPRAARSRRRARVSA